MQGAPYIRNAIESLSFSNLGPLKFLAFSPSSKLSTYPLYHKKTLELFIIFTTEAPILSKVDKTYQLFLILQYDSRQGKEHSLFISFYEHRN